MNSIKYILKITLGVLLGLSFRLQAQDIDTLQLNLDVCRSMAIENSKTVQLAAQDQQIAAGQKKVARASWLPNISASATGMYNKNQFQTELMLPTKTFNPLTGQLDPNIALNPLTGEPIIGPDGNPVFNTYAYLPLDITLYGGMLASVTADQPIYAGGKIIAANKMANIGENMAEENRVLKTNAVIYEADRTYYQYMSVKEKVKLAKKYQDLLSELVDVVTDSYETGMINKNELLKVQVQYNEATLQLQKAKTGMELSRMDLCRVLGIDFTAPLQITDSLSYAFDLKNMDQPATASNRIEYQLLQQQIKMAEQNIKMVRGDYLPQAGVSVGYNYFNIGLQDLDNYDSHGISAIGNVKIPITTFGERKGKMQVARAELQQKKLQLEQASQLLQLEIEQARLNYKDALTRVAMSRESLKQARENLRISKDNYDLGMETIVNLLEAQAKWQKAYSNKIDAVTEFKVQESNYLRVLNAFNLVPNNN